MINFKIHDLKTFNSVGISTQVVHTSIVNYMSLYNRTGYIGENIDTGDKNNHSHVVTDMWLTNDALMVRIKPLNYGAGIGLVDNLYGMGIGMNCNGKLIGSVISDLEIIHTFFYKKKVFTVGTKIII